MSEAADLAQRFFDEGYNCAESTLTALAIHFGKTASNIPRIATAFGGGMSRTRNLCGAVTGALMALGLICGRNQVSDDKDRCYNLAAALIARFQERHGSINCYELTGLDFNQPNGQKEYKDKVHHEICVPLVRFTVDAVMELAGSPK